MALCKKCESNQAGFLSDYCGRCISEGGSPFLQPQVDSAEAEEVSGADSVGERGSAALCILLGLVCLGIGGYLLIDPTVTVPGYGGIGTAQVANIHMMTLGETLSIVGAIFLAAGIRPRKD